MQLGRRNIVHPLDRVILLEVKRPILERRAQERQLAGRADEDADLALKSAQGTTSEKKGRRPTVTEQLAIEAGMARSTYDDCLLVLEKAIPALIKFVKEGEIKVTSAGKLLRSHPRGKCYMTDEEHRAWQQELVDNVSGDPDAVQAVVRNINRDARQYERMRAREREEQTETKRKEEEFQAQEERDEEEIAKWRRPRGRAESPGGGRTGRSRIGTRREEQEAPRKKRRAVGNRGGDPAATAGGAGSPARKAGDRGGDRRRIVDATQGVLASRGLGMSVEGQEIWRMSSRPG